MTYRERREAKAARLEEWAQKRQEKAQALLAQDAHYRGDIAFNTQPGRIPERARVIARTERAFESMAKAGEMQARAFGIADQLDRSIYSDDPDAIERLQERIEALKAKRDEIKAANAAFRKTHKAELAALTSAYQRDQAMPHQGYSLTNLSADIRRNEQRLAQLTAAADGSRPLRVIQAHRAGDCDRCTQPVNVGDYIGKYADGWSHVSGTPWTRCGLYAVKCDDCKAEMRRSDDLGESARGGRCEDCR